MKKIIYFLSLSFLMLSCSNDETTDTDEIDNGIFEIQIKQGGDFQSYETVITTSLTGSSFTDCEGNEVDNLILYSLTNIESCSIKANNTATQMTGSILLKKLDSNNPDIGDSTFNVNILLDGESIYEATEIRTNTTFSNEQINFDLNPADY